MRLPPPSEHGYDPIAPRALDTGAMRSIRASRRSLRRWFGPGAGGLVVLAVVGMWVAWVAQRVADVAPQAPLPRAIPEQALMGSVATLPGRGAPRAVRLAAPAPARDDGGEELRE